MVDFLRSHDFDAYPELTNSQMQTFYFDSPHKQITTDFDATVTKVHDGDTITVKTDFRDFEFPIRFLFTAAPELNEEGGAEAQKFMEQQLLNKDVNIRIRNRNRVGKYGRLLGEVIADGISMNELIITSGYAKPFKARKEDQIPDFNVTVGFAGGIKNGA